MISEVIRHVVNQGWTTQMELAEIAGVSDTSVGRYSVDESEPSFRTVRAWVHHHKNPHVRQAFADLFMEGTGGQAILPVDDTEADINGDGKVTCDDALDAVIKATGEAHDALVAVRAVTRDGHLSVNDMLESKGDIHAGIRSLRAALRALELCVDRPRPKARPARLGGVA